MSSNLGVGKTLELLERLRGTVREFAARAEKLNAEFHARTGKEQRLRAAAAEQEAKELAAAMAEADAAFAAAKDAARAKHEARKRAARSQDLINTPREARPSRGVSFPSRSSASPPVPPNQAAPIRVNTALTLMLLTRVSFAPPFRQAEVYPISTDSP